MGVYITKFGEKYHVFRYCSTLSSLVLRNSPPRHQRGFTNDMSYVRRGELRWCCGRGKIYHSSSPNPRPCATGREKRCDICDLRSRTEESGLNM